VKDDGVRRGPGIRCPPPVYFLGAGVAAWGLGRWQPLAIDAAGRDALQSGAGWVLTAGGLGLVGWGLATLIRLRTTFLPDREATRLVVIGPYRFSRNPMYLGMASTYAGVALLANSGWAATLLPAVLLLVATQVIRREERYLAHTFGEEYSAYGRRVRRWL
jgi:protein-S-isoprenylcysteine O-methyltransferase Ste14